MQIHRRERSSVKSVIMRKCFKVYKSFLKLSGWFEKWYSNKILLYIIGLGTTLAFETANPHIWKARTKKWHFCMIRVKQLINHWNDWFLLYRFISYSFQHYISQKEVTVSKKSPKFLNDDLKSTDFNVIYLNWCIASKATLQVSSVVSKRSKSPPPWLKQNHQITTLPRESRLAGTAPVDTFRTCLVVVWLMGKGRAAGTRGPISGRKIDGQSAYWDKRKRERKGSVAAWMQTTAACQIAGLC